MLNAVMIEQQKEILFNREIARDTFLMGLRSSEIAAAARPGQFVMIRVRPGLDPLLRRPFSICAVQEDELFLILYRVVGKGTAIMAETPDGDSLSILGPLGNGFVLANPPKQSILIAGGIGAAPLLFLAQCIKTGPLQLMMGFGSADEIIALEQILERTIDFVIATDDGSAGHAGPVTDLLEAQLNKNEFEENSVSIFTCGPKPMMKKVATMAIERDIPCQASLEAVMACGLGACQGCSVKTASNKNRTYSHVCTDGPVFPVMSIDWNWQ
jgi:dihydroorotate dehydrogenase electron transfer subunit